MSHTNNDSEQKKRLREIIERCMPNRVKEHIEGVLYQQWTGPYKPSVAFEKLKQIKFRKDDVVSTGYPRSGNHWAYFVLDMILKQSATLATKSFVESIMDLYSDEEMESMLNGPSPRLFCTHAKLSRVPHVAEGKPKIVYILRNPKDAFVSSYKCLMKYTEDQGFHGTWDEFFDATMGGEMFFGDWCEYVLFMEKYMEENPQMSFYIHQFEEMREDPVGCVKRLCAFLGVADDLAEDIVAASDVANLKTAVTNQTRVNKAYFGEHAKETGWIQKGMIGNWKKTFTVEQNERFNQDFEKKMAGSKLADRIRKYIY